MRVLAFRASFDGLYEWGRGWISHEKAEAWRKYFLGLEGYTFWDIHCNSRKDTMYLVGNGCSVYLHPMDITAVAHKMGKTSHFEDGKEVEDFMDIDELKEILAGAAKACGGTVRFSEIVTSEIPTPMYKERQDD